MVALGTFSNIIGISTTAFAATGTSKIKTCWAIDSTSGWTDATWSYANNIFGTNYAYKPTVDIKQKDLKMLCSKIKFKISDTNLKKLIKKNNKSASTADFIKKATTHSGFKSSEYGIMEIIIGKENNSYYKRKTINGHKYVIVQYGICVNYKDAWKRVLYSGGQPSVNALCKIEVRYKLS